MQPSASVKCGYRLFGWDILSFRSLLLNILHAIYLNQESVFVTGKPLILRVPVFGVWYSDTNTG